MTLTEGSRARLLAEIRLPGPVTLAADPEAAVGFLSLAAGAEGVVERAEEDQDQGREVGEYLRLKSLFDDFGHQMPPGSRQQLADQVAALEPAWLEHERRGPRVSVRVRFDNGFVLDGAPGEVFAAV
ncbi:hypothetical protein [Streptomyces sp. NPDC089919]|uniref:hypothetical protein n=1 Tax=Streptomyces sp. NPDC089919 TaxID=3155188 RepID=UPI00343A8E5D